MNRLATCTLSVALGLTAVPAFAENGDAATSRPFDDHRELVAKFDLGYRGSFVTSAGYNPFSTNDYLPQLSIAATRTLWANRSWSFALGIGWDYANAGALALGDTTSLTLDRLTVPIEGRRWLGRWGYVFLRAAPGIAYESVEVDDSSTPSNDLTKSRWLFAADVSGGYAVPLWSRADPSRPFSHLWAQADGGYGFIADQRLNLAPNGQPRGEGPDLGVLALRGAFFRIAIAASL
jgi:hypothetical protein